MFRNASLSKNSCNEDGLSHVDEGFHILPSSHCAGELCKGWFEPCCENEHEMCFEIKFSNEIRERNNNNCCLLTVPGE